ncbi:MAG: type III secretion system export apparatus subunit SctR [bacterium]|nr:type III secretion system export apparatus subunit SctR [bacterium]
MKSKTRRSLFVLLFFSFIFLPASVVLGQAGVPLTQTITEQAIARPMVLLLVLVGLSLIPFLVMMTTSFVKIAVVLALVRNAMGTQQIPPNQIITGLAMILTVYIMIPVGIQIYDISGNIINRGSTQPVLSQTSVNLLLEGIGKGKEPVREFLKKNAHEKEKKLFFSLAKRMRTDPGRENITEDDFTVLIPSFVISELTEAFQIGFIIFLPFLVIDLVVTNVLLSLGMFQISPITISLPFKLLLFVLVDGWYLIAKGLIMGYL